ncbi:MAG: hypothetical protein HY698_15335 [Deltaproteobacteria bacterium]|nr:hypothetical protein [Deltaproteobacteria bacterium]
MLKVRPVLERTQERTEKDKWQLWDEVLRDVVGGAKKRPTNWRTRCQCGFYIDSDDPPVA